MKSKNIPFLLVYSRVIFGLIIGITAAINPENSGLIIAFLMLLGLVSDILDGVIARKLKVDTLQLRVLDSNVDLFFWSATILSVFVMNWEYVQAHSFYILIVIGLEVLAYFISFIKYKKSISTHIYLAKIWSILLFLFLVELILSHNSSVLFQLVVWIGVVSRVEIIGIILYSKESKTDVSSLF